jgi:Peptidase A4 family/Putative Ig domain
MNRVHQTGRAVPRGRVWRLGGLAAMAVLAAYIGLVVPTAAPATAAPVATPSNGALTTATPASNTQPQVPAPAPTIPTPTPTPPTTTTTTPPAVATTPPTALPTSPAGGATLPPTEVASRAAASPGGGYWEVASDGGVFAFGTAGYFGSTGAIKLNRPIVGMAPTADGQGYWLVASDGGIFAFGDAGFFGSTGAMTLNQPIVGMAATPDGKGYWLVASDGGIFAFGDAGFFGSTGAMTLNQPIVGMAASPDGKGYWLVASDGGIFTFGDAGYFGSTGNIRLNRPIVGMSMAPNGQGYWLVASDGGVFTFGDAGYFGSAPSVGTSVGNVVAMAAAANGQGYWITGSNGGITFFGDASSNGTTAGTRLNKPIVGFAAAPQALPSQEAPAPLTITTASLGNADVGVPYAVSLTATGGTAPYTWSVSGGSLPAGLTLSPSGALTGTPTALGNATFTVHLVDATTPTPLVDTVALTISVMLAPLTITTTSLPNATLGSGYAANVSATGGTSPYTFSLSHGSLPAGLTLSAAGLITGIPSVQGNSTFTVQVVDSTPPTPMSTTVTLAISVFPDTVSTSSVLSSNWSGYIELHGPFTAVTGTFSVPSLFVGTPQSDLMSAWVGIDGGNGDNSLIQAGINESPDPNNANDFIIQPWWEILPASETYITSVQVRAGDQVTIDIGQISGTQWGITLTDITNGQSFTTDQTYSGPAATAEWIVEALTLNGQVAPLAPYSPPVNFSNLRFFGSNTTLQEVVMVQGNNQVSTPSALTPNGFRVGYGSAAPAAP